MKLTLTGLSFAQLDALLVDYLHPRKFALLGKVLPWVLRATTVGVLVGVYQFNTNDIGASSSPPARHAHMAASSDLFGPACSRPFLLSSLSLL